MKNPQQLQNLREAVEPACVAQGVALVDARFCNEGGMVLKVLIERPDSDPATGAGISLDDCQAISRELSEVLDEREDLTPKAPYRLEVGSPGLERPLFGLQDFERFAGREIRLQSTRPVEGRRRFTGELQGVEGQDVLLKQDAETVRIPHPDIAKANLVYRF